MNDKGIYYFKNGKLQFCFVEKHLLGKKAYNKTYTIHDNFYTKQACIDSNKSKTLLLLFIPFFYANQIGCTIK